MAVEITVASLDRLAPLASVFGRSFVVEPMMLWSLGDHGDVEERFTRRYVYYLEAMIPLGMVWEAGAADGAAGWSSPVGAEASLEGPGHDTRIDGLTQDGGRRNSLVWE